MNLRILLSLSLIFSVFSNLYSQLYINEVSQGTGNQEYVELIVAGTPSCGDSTVNLQGWILDDNCGFFGNNGIAGGHIKFTNDPQWASIKYGTMILIYRGDDIFPGIVADENDSNNDDIYILPSSSNLFDRNSALPIGGTPITSYTTTGYVNGGGSWTMLGMSNTSDAFQTVSPTDLTTAFHSVGWGNGTAGTDVYFTGSASGFSFVNENITNDDPNNQANWVAVSSSTQGTPGVANSPSNGTWISSLLAQASSGGNTLVVNYDTICTGDSLFLANAWQNTSGTYYDTILGAGGTTTTDTIYTETFDGVQTWTLNTTNFPAQNGADPNFWTISDNEAGVLPPGCGVAGGGNKSMHITSVAFPTFGAAYDAGGLCGLWYCPMTNTDATSPNISTVGYTNLVLTFDYIANGQGLLDNASLLYSDNGGASFTVLDNSLKSLVCGGGQGQWTAASYNLPVSTENIANLQIRFNWVNNDDGAGTDPSVAINNVRVAGDMASSGGCDTIVQTNLTVTNVVVTNTNITTCDSTIVNGTSYYASGNFNIDSLYNANGCLISYTQVGIDMHYSQSTNSSASICAGDSIFLANAWQNTAGTYYDTLQTSTFPNCDSIVATTLTVNNCTTIEASFIPSTTIICVGDSITFTDNSTGTGINSWNWIFTGTPVAGQGPHTIAFNTAGIYNINLLIGDGTLTADTTIVITVNDIATSTVNTSACDSLTLLGNTYYTNTTINDTLAAASVNACDSIVTYHIVINNSVSNTINNTSCSAADTGTVVQNFLTMNGCDSVLTTITTLVPITTTTQNTTTCTNNSSQAGITTDTILSVGGCDSIYNVSTVIFQNIQNIILNSQEICEGESAVIFGQSQTISDTYTNTISSSLGCDSVVESIELIVNPLPNINAGNDETIQAGNTISLTAEGGDTYVWSTNETNQTITISPTETSTYYVTGTDVKNCVNSDTILITVIINEVKIQIPTAFSPNGDGLNDTFKIVNQEEFEDIELRVYNRWGELVFISNKELIGWDGTYKNIAQELDSYIYYIDAKSKASGQAISVSGSVALIR